MRFAIRKTPAGTKWAVLALLLCLAGCGTFGEGKKSSALSQMLEANGFKEKETEVTLISDNTAPVRRMPITDKKAVWQALGAAYAVESFKWKNFYNLELKSKTKVAHLYARNDDSCALFFRDLEVESPDFSKNDPHIYYLAPGIHLAILGEIMKPPQDASKKTKSPK
jgi:hypothetical protein